MSKGQNGERPRLYLNQRGQRIIRKQLRKMNNQHSAWIDSTAWIDRTWPRGVHIGANCRIDEHAVILTHDMTRGLYLDTRIGERTSIGARAIVLPGVTIGPGCKIAPGSVVIGDLPPDSQVCGNPAKPISEP